MIVITPEFLVRANATLEGVLKALDRSGRGIVLVVDAYGHLEGVVTDHDIRKALLKGATLRSTVDPYVNRNPTVARVGAPREEIAGILRATQKAQLPLIDEDGRPVALETLSTMMLSEAPRHDHVAVLMAGGLGTRLQPLTASTPKPLLPIGDKPLLHIIIEELKRYGFHRFYITLHYGADQIERHFGDGTALDASVKYIHEMEPLGTAGALALLPPDATELPFLVMNGDLLTRLNFESLLRFHVQSERHMTMCVRQHGMEIPYGVVDLQDDRVLGVREKPQEVCFINAGIYVLDKQVLSLIPAQRRYDITELINAVAQHGPGVGSFPIHEYWLDIGRHSDYERAHLEYERHF